MILNETIVIAYHDALNRVESYVTTATNEPSKNAL